jgi:hypothetical protein
MRTAQRTASTSRSLKVALVVAIQVPVALLHFVTGPGYGGPWPAFVNGYLIDILLPLALYFLLCLNDWPWLHVWLKGLLVIGLAIAVESAQGLGLPVLGQTYDPLDFAAYAAGVALALVLDALVFPRVFAFWAPARNGADS